MAVRICSFQGEIHRGEKFFLRTRQKHNGGKIPVLPALGAMKTGSELRERTGRAILLLKTNSDIIELSFIPTEKNDTMKLLKENPKNAFAAQLGITAASMTAATLLSMLFRSTDFSESNIVVIYILSVLMVSRFTRGYGWGILASVIGMFSFNFFFTEPYHTFHVYNRSYLVTFFVMLTASILTSALTSKILRSSQEAIRREKQTNMLYRITSSLAKASSVNDVATVSVQSISNLLDCNVSCLLADQNGRFSTRYGIRRGERRVEVATITGGAESFLQENDIWPIADREHQYGLICLSRDRACDTVRQDSLLSAVCTQIFTAMERERLAEEKERAKDEAEREKFKSSLLRSISHDLRTPLAGIAGSAEILAYSLKDEESRKLVQGICDDAGWLTRMIENILSLTKIQEGKLLVNKKPEAVEEIVGEAVARVAKYADSRTIRPDIPGDVLFVPMDGKLIEQVLINLLDNAVKHSGPESPVSVQVRQEKERVWFAVIDRGTGMNPKELPKVFDLFYSGGSRADSKRGIGLGLPICRAIVNAHGGEIYAENNPGRGMTLRFFLPLKEGATDGNG
jgi:two-component system sensor histidine kinase KdpD